MRKRNKLYKANKWNKTQFAEGIDREHQNIYDGLGSSTLNTSTAGLGKGYGVLGNPSYINKSQIATMKTPNSHSGRNLGLSTGVNAALGAAAIGTSAIDKSEANPRGAFDLLDPVHQMAGGKESSIGNGLEDAGVSTFQAAAQSGNVPGMLAGTVLKITGGAWNALGGIKTDKQKLNAANASIEQNQNYDYSQTLDDIQGPAALVSAAGTYKGGVFSKGKAARKNAELQKDIDTAYSWATRSMENNVYNLKSDQMNNMLANYAAFGGPLGNSSSGAIDYGFMSDYLTAKNKAVEAKNKLPNNIFGSIQSPQTMFALGGDIQSNSSDFTTGLSHIDAGGSHEENPYEGVQVGISQENGMPNLVEEGETIFDDYVFSKRIKPDKQTKKKFHVGAKSKVSFADLSKKLEKESLERPNDPLSQAALTEQLHALAEEQERQKVEEQQAEAEAMFASLPPEQQQEIMQQMAMQEQQAQQQEAQAMQEGQPMEAQEQQEPQQMVDEQMQAEQANMQPQMEETQMAASGGMINRFDIGGDLKKAIYKALGFYTDRQFDDWRKSNKLEDIDWNTANENTTLWEAIGNKGNVLKHLKSNGYFDGYTPSADTLTFDFKYGGWGLEDYDAWDGSTDEAWLEAVKKGLVKKGMNSEEIGKALSQTNAYKRGTDWLKASDENRLKYLQAIYNSKDTDNAAPQGAIDYAGKFVDANGWKKGAKTDYQTIFEDPNGTGVRNTHPGTYWKTPKEVLREARAKDYVVNEDGTIDEIIGDVPKELTLDGTYNWKTKDYDETANYYKAAAKGKEANKGKAEDAVYEPVHKSELPRQLGLYGPAVGLGMQIAGIGKPNYDRLDKALAIANGAPALATYKPIGDYLQYKPMDIWYEQNRQNANARATDRAILNNSTPLTAKSAEIIANAYNNQIASGNLYRQALEYNNAMDEKSKTFNRGTNQYNAEAFNNTSKVNAEILNSNRRYRAEAMKANAIARMDADSQWNAGIYGNVSKFFSNLGELGKENAQHNMIADMAADNLFGTLSDKQNIGKGYVVRRVAAKGGKLNKRRRGLTF